MKRAFQLITAFSVSVLTLLGSTCAAFAAEEQSLGEKMALAGRNTLIGLVIVFVILLALSLIIGLFRFLPKGNKIKKEPAAVKTSAVEPVKKAAAPDEEDPELIAVIMAAIAVSEGENYEPGKYRLASMREIKTSGRWKRVWR